MKKILLYFNSTLIISSTVTVPTLSCIPRTEQFFELNEKEKYSDYEPEETANTQSKNLNQMDLVSNNVNQLENNNQGHCLENNLSESNSNFDAASDKEVKPEQNVIQNDRNNRDSFLIAGINYAGYENFVQKYEEKILNKASAESIEKFNQLYDIDNSEKIFNSWENLQNLLLNTVLEENHKTNVNWMEIFNHFKLNDNFIKLYQDKLLRFYNIIAKLYNTNDYDVLKWLKRVQPDINAGDFGCTMPILEDICMTLGKLSFNKEIIDYNYLFGFWSSHDIVTTPVHEYGHILSMFLGLKHQERLNINTENVKFNLDYLSSVNFLMNFLNNKAGITDDNEKELFPLIIVRSGYSRAWKTGYDPKDEFFAEAFAQWLLTPENLRGWNWELLNEFFMEEVPKILKGKLELPLLNNDVV